MAEFCTKICLNQWRTKRERGHTHCAIRPMRSRDTNTEEERPGTSRSRVRQELWPSLGSRSGVSDHHHSLGRKTPTIIARGAWCGGPDSIAVIGRKKIRFHPEIKLLFLPTLTAMLSYACIKSGKLKNAGGGDNRALA